ncbi:MAG TPA: class 1 fructose-bisphosphatase [Gemmatimonadales bacterium]|nr:class 1 fructose-bisphosphatase [Gemmatimonadales bacterium]
MPDRTKVTTLERFILDQEHSHPEATSELTNLLYDVALAAKLIAAQIRRAGLVGILGTANAINVQGEEQQKLDVFANETMKNALNHTGRVCAMASEEDEQLIPIPDDYPAGRYCVLFDPLDGSSNIDVNSSVGTIFAIFHRISTGGPGTLADVLQPGTNLVAAGYVMYGSSVMMVYSAGHGVHGFTLDPTIGEFLLSHPDMTTPATGKYYSANEANFGRWSPGVQRAMRGFHGDDPERMKGKNARYAGSLVADFHRNLIAGGVFLYPGDTTNPAGKLRLLYECVPMAYLVEAAGGKATNGTQRILDIVPTDLHQRTPLVIGGAADVDYVQTVLAEAGAARG